MSSLKCLNMFVLWSLSCTVPATCWGFMGPAFFMNESSLSNARIGSLAILFSDFSRAPFVVLPWFVRWMISPKWSVSPLAGRPFSCLAGWTPLTTWTEGLLQRWRHREEYGCTYDGSEWLMQQMSHSTTVQLRESLKIYPEKCVRIRRVNISNNRSISSVLRLLTVDPESCGSLCFPLRFRTTTVNSWLALLAYKFYTVHGGLASVWAQWNFSMLFKQKER